VSQFPARGVTELVSGAKEHIGFLRAQRSYLQGRLAALALLPKPAAMSLSSDRPVHVVVVPQEGSDFDSFAPGARNLYYEAAQSLREILGSKSVSVFHVAPGENPDAWHQRLIDFVRSVNATHLLGHVESDPGQVDSPWTWDVLWSQLSAQWDGILLGAMFDSSYQWLAAQSRLLARISDRFVLIDICIPMDGRMVGGRPEVGPVIMPMSRESLSLLDSRLEGLVLEFDVSFIGTMYPHRVELVEALRAEGVSVAVNPHRSDAAEDFATSRHDQPSWLDYMAGLASSRMTLNFSQSSAGRFVQLKTRVLEAGLAGTLLLTDDLDRTSRFFVPEEEYGYFHDVQALPAVIAGFLADSERINCVAAAGAERARELAPVAFWQGIDSGLARRDLGRIF
jgi:hypothetical protein